MTKKKRSRRREAHPVCRWARQPSGVKVFHKRLILRDKPGAKRFSGQPSERRRSEDVNKLAESFEVWTPPECDQVGRTVKLAMGTDVAAVADFQSKIPGGRIHVEWSVCLVTVLLFWSQLNQRPVFLPAASLTRRWLQFLRWGASFSFSFWSSGLYMEKRRKIFNEYHLSLPKYFGPTLCLKFKVIIQGSSSNIC